MGSKKNVDMSADKDVIKVVAGSSEETKVDAPLMGAEDTKGTTKKVPKMTQRLRSKKYKASRSKVDKTKKHSVSEAVALVKKLSYAKFDGTITIDGVVRETGKIGTFSLPHSTGKTIKVAIVDDAVIEQIAAGNIDFDALVTTPAFMPKLARHARTLGPKGLMPNPKNGTVTAKPEEKKAELEKGSFDLKTQKKEPVIHVTMGKVSMDDKVLIENIEYILNSLKGKLVQASISASMTPGVKIEVVG